MEEVQVQTGTKRPHPGGEGGGPGFGKRGPGFNSQFGGRSLGGVVCSTKYFLHDLSLDRRKSDWILSLNLIDYR